MTRAYFACPGYGLGGYALYQRRRISGAPSRQARRVVCWAGGRIAFAQAAEALEQVGVWTVIDETVRRASQVEAAALAAWRPTVESAVVRFRAAEGPPEFLTGAAKAATDTGWRDVKIRVFSKRPRASPPLRPSGRV